MTEDLTLEPGPIAVVLEINDHLTAGHLRSFVALLDVLGVEDDRFLSPTSEGGELYLLAWAGSLAQPAPATGEALSLQHGTRPYLS